MKKMQPIGDFRAVENSLAQNLDLKDYLLSIAEKVMPFIKADVDAGDVVKILERATPLAMLTFIDLMMNGGERSKLVAAEKIAYMGGYKPTEKSVNIEGDISNLGANQLDAFLKNAFNKLSDEEKNNVINLIKTPSGEYKVPEGNQLPSLTPDDIEKEDF